MNACFRTPEDYELFLKFFEFLDRWVDRRTRNFEYNDFLSAYRALMEHMQENQMRVPIIFRTADTFLQFLFELNIICFIERSKKGHEFLRWCFRERSYANIRPKVRTHQRYKLHLGIAHALNVGIAS